ncbi:MAG: hypothetical protein JET69_05820 [Methanomassiliicoccales archaeon]|nr:hypothetical protein [Methanomassiliicoccales archaeon]
MESQGEAQKLRILSVGASTLDTKALTVLSLDALKKLGEGQATKIVLPFELTRLVEGISDYVGGVRSIPEREISKPEEIERTVGKADIILGPIPTQEELRRDMKELEVAMAQERREAEAIKAGTRVSLEKDRE